MSGRPLRVAQLVCSDGFAGVERHVAGLSRTLAARGHQLVVIGGHHARMPAELAGQDGARWRPADTVGAAMRELARLGRTDIVHAHMTRAEFAAVLARPKHRANVVATRHFARRRGSSPMMRVASRIVARGIDAQIAVSHYVAGAIDGTSSVIHAGIDEPVKAPDPADRSSTVLVVSRLEAEKRVDIALRVWQRSRLADDGWHLAIAGDGAQRAALGRLAAELGITASCRFLGARDDIAAQLDMAGIVLATCPIEAFGLAVVEAMAHAVPVVAVAGGAHSEILGTSARPFLFAPDDPAEGAAMLRELAGSADKRRRVGDELREVQRDRFAASRQAEQVERLYRSVRQDPA